MVKSARTTRYGETVDLGFPQPSSNYGGRSCQGVPGQLLVLKMPPEGRRFEARRLWS